jgi:hypothetical protein
MILFCLTSVRVFILSIPRRENCEEGDDDIVAMNSLGMSVCPSEMEDAFPLQITDK